MDINISLPELYMLIGEREVIKYKLGEEIKQKDAQIFEMSEEIVKLHTEIESIKNGKLG